MDSWLDIYARIRAPGIEIARCNLRFDPTEDAFVTPELTPPRQWEINLDICNRIPSFTLLCFIVFVNFVCFIDAFVKIKMHERQYTNFHKTDSSNQISIISCQMIPRILIKYQDVAFYKNCVNKIHNCNK